MNKEKSCCFTGHRLIPDDRYYRVMFLLRQTVEQKIKEGYTTFCAGGAQGFDTMAALAVMNLKRVYPQVQLHLYLPCRNQAEKWKSADKEMYNKILKAADKIVYISDEYTPYCMNRRNRALVDNSSLCIAYCTQTGGGTVYTVSYAIDNGVDVINLAEQTDKI
ncbi:MAG: DUF1273 family protein [Oscillospiraceae bacterium]|nr:DUF1273 family protein [Oscillospiraceae bacterium]